MRFRLFSILLGLICLCSTPSVTLAIVNGEEPDITDRRFDAIAAFSRTNWLNGTDFEHNHFCNGTLIAPDRMVLSRHCVSFGPDDPQPPSGTYSFRFRRNPDGSLGTKADGWESFHQVEVTHFTFPDSGLDILIAHLATPVTHIKPLPIADPTEFGAGDEIIVAGWGKEGPGFNEGPRGRLLLADMELTAVNPYSVNFLSAWNTNSDCGCGPNMFDSGGAILVERRNRVPLVSGNVGSQPLTGGAMPLGAITGPTGTPGQLKGVLVEGVIRPYVIRARVELLAVTCCTSAGIIARTHQEIDPCYTDDLNPPDGCFTDLNGDLVTDSADLNILLAAYGPCDCGDPCDAYDFNNDLVVNEKDAQVILDAFGTYCPCPISNCGPDHCPADFNRDNVVDEADIEILESMLAYPNNCAECGDLNGDGVFDTADIQTAWDSLGVCPCDMTIADTPNCPWDLDGNGIVDRTDLGLMYRIVARPGCELRCDFDNDGVITNADFELLAANFGDCP